MLKWEELRRTPGSSEIMYSWQETPESPVRIWAIERLQAWLDTNPAGVELKTTIVDHKTAQFYAESRGLELHRLESLVKNPEACLRPVILMRLEAEEHGKPMDLMLDGHHRYFVITASQWPYIQFYHITEEQASRFEVEDPPLSGTINPNTFSGLEV